MNDLYAMADKKSNALRSVIGNEKSDLMWTPTIHIANEWKDRP
jgi:hypothetical protein